MLSIFLKKYASKKGIKRHCVYEETKLSLHSFLFHLHKYLLFLHAVGTVIGSGGSPILRLFPFGGE